MTRKDFCKLARAPLSALAAKRDSSVGGVPIGAQSYGFRFSRCGSRYGGSDQDSLQRWHELCDWRQSRTLRERLGVKLPGPTRPCRVTVIPTVTGTNLLGRHTL